MRAGRREGVGRSRRKRHARGRPESRLLGGQGTRGAHQEHVAHGRDLRLEVSKLSGWLNARAYCRVEGKGMRCGARCGPGGGRVWGCGGTSGMHGRRPDPRLLGVRARAERTWNMPAMVVTLEVSKLSGWLKACAE